MPFQEGNDTSGDENEEKMPESLMSLEELLAKKKAKKEEEDKSIPTEYDVEQLKLKEERLGKEAKNIDNEPIPTTTMEKERKERLQKEWVEDKKTAQRQRKIHETLGVRKTRRAA